MIVCRICDRASPDWKGLHKHIASAHSIRAAAYYTKFPAQLCARIMECVEIQADGCWRWTGLQTKRGYGRMRVAGLDTCAAHRISFLAHTGSLPADLCLLHACDFPSCVNPKHLTPGTVHENNTDRARKNRSHRVLTDETVYRVRELLGWGWPFERIRDETGAAMGSIAQIRDRRSHAHVYCDPNEFLF